jgi:hypothetical protein
MNASIVFIPAVPHSDGRAFARLSLTNVLGALDQGLHGSAHLRGWGSTTNPDPVLYQVRGFDPASKQFIYEVNPAFGNSQARFGVPRTPFRVTLDLSFNIGPSFQRQALAQNLRVRPHLVGTRAPADSLKNRYMRRNFTDIYGVLLGLADSLALSRSQIDELQDERILLLRTADSIYTDLSVYLAALPANYDEKEALRRIDVANSRAWQAIYDEKPFLLRTLTPGQLRLLPHPLFQMLTVPGFQQRFFFG